MQVIPFYGHSWPQKLFKNRKIGCHLFLIVNFLLRSSGMGFMIKKTLGLPNSIYTEGQPVIPPYQVILKRRFIKHPSFLCPWTGFFFWSRFPLWIPFPFLDSGWEPREGNPFGLVTPFQGCSLPIVSSWYTWWGH